MEMRKDLQTRKRRACEEGLADEEEESMQDALDSLDTAVIPGLVLGAVSSSGRRSRQPVYLQQYFLH